MEEFRKTKYGRWYIQLIQNRHKNAPLGYCEKHHITPRGLGGGDEDTNIVKLTAREHYVAHLLLTKMFPFNIQKTAKMIRAWGAMMWWRSKNQERVCRVNSRMFEILRVRFANILSISQTGMGNSQYNSKWVYNESLMKCKKIDIHAAIEDGWSVGRVFNWDKYFSRKVKSNKIKQIKTCKHCSKKYSNRLSNTKFCSVKCGGAYEYHLQPKYINIIRNNQIKTIKRQDFGAYQKIGWLKSN